MSIIKKIKNVLYVAVPIGLFAFGQYLNGQANHCKIISSVEVEAVVTDSYAKKEYEEYHKKGKTLKAGETHTLLFVFEIKKPKDDSNFLLTYQTSNVHKNATRIRIKVVDISRLITKATSKLGENLEVPINLNKKWT